MAAGQLSELIQLRLLFHSSVPAAADKTHCVFAFAFESCADAL
uniref:Uncharacterized protein n=1 Tax=Anguilla anguilla TaxID=7936 RepID=A0A0E9PSS9_ANGAN